MQGDFYAYTLAASKAILILLSFAILLRCLRSMLREEYDPETWAYLRYGRDRLPGGAAYPLETLPLYAAVCGVLPQLARSRGGERLHIHRLPLHLHRHLRLSKGGCRAERCAGSEGVFISFREGGSRSCATADGSDLLLLLGARRGDL